METLITKESALSVALLFADAGIPCERIIPLSEVTPIGSKIYEEKIKNGGVQTVDEQDQWFL